jgi:hypothetical protein
LSARLAKAIGAMTPWPGASIEGGIAMKSHYVSTVLSVLACAAAVAAPAQGPDNPTGTLPEAHAENGIRYVCGGVGSDEAAILKQAAREHDLVLTFATREGNYLADVDVNIADARGRSLLSTTCDGPIMLVDLPKAGTYRVRADVDGREATAKVQLSSHAKGKHLSLVLPRARDDQG